MGQNLTGYISLVPQRLALTIEKLSFLYALTKGVGMGKRIMHCHRFNNAQSHHAPHSHCTIIISFQSVQGISPSQRSWIDWPLGPSESIHIGLFRNDWIWLWESAQASLAPRLFGQLRVLYVYTPKVSDERMEPQAESWFRKGPYCFPQALGKPTVYTSGTSAFLISQYLRGHNLGDRFLYDDTDTDCW